MLSGGQRQSVAIAKGVLWSAKLVVMDEPTAALGRRPDTDGAGPGADPRERGHAVLLISHNMNDVFAVADRTRRAAARPDGRCAADRPERSTDRRGPDDLGDEHSRSARPANDKE